MKGMSDEPISEVSGARAGAEAGVVAGVVAGVGAGVGAGVAEEAQVPRFLVQARDEFRTTTEDAIRVWITDGGDPEQTMTVAVMVRVVSSDRPLHDAISKLVRQTCENAVAKLFEPEQVMLATMDMKQAGTAPVSLVKRASVSSEG